MTAVIGAKADKQKAIDILENVLHNFVSVGLSPMQVQGVRDHLRWMRSQDQDLNVNCRLETVPELLTTRVVLEYSFLPIAPLKTN